MNAHDLFDRAIGQNEDAAHDGEAAELLTTIRRSVDRLLNDGEGPEPPADLAERTLARLRSRRDILKFEDYEPVRSRWRWGDIAVAATVLIAGTLALFPAILRSRMQVAQLQCVNNLRQIGLALNQYAHSHNSYPGCQPDHPAGYVGSSFVQLRDAGYLIDTAVVDCPCNGLRERSDDDFPCFEDLHQTELKQPGSCRQRIDVDYAYQHGHRSGNSSGPLSFRVEDRVPIVADQPPYQVNHRGYGRILDGNSPNHGGGGQNVLFTGGHVRYQTRRFVGPRDRDVFLNERSKLAPGLHKKDAVLTPAVFRYQR